MSNVYPFVEKPANIEVVKASKAYKLREKIDKGERLTPSEKLWITENVGDCSFSRTGVAILGWIVSFRDVLKRMLYRQYGSWHETYAVNKTYLRKSTYGRIDEIVELA